MVGARRREANTEIAANGLQLGPQRHVEKNGQNQGTEETPYISGDFDRIRHSFTPTHNYQI